MDCGTIVMCAVNAGILRLTAQFSSHLFDKMHTPVAFIPVYYEEVLNDIESDDQF